MTPRWRLVSVLAAFVVVAIALSMTSPVKQAWCDGTAPGWVENKGGCAEWSMWEYLYPWHWGIPDQCLGLCDNSLRP